MTQKSKFTGLIRLWGIILIVGVAGSHAVFGIIGSYRDFKTGSEQMRSDYIASQKQTIKQEVTRVVDFIRYEKSQSEFVARKRIKSRVYEAFAIAQEIYRKNKSTKNKDEIQTMILDALRPIRFENGSGYYFATRMNGIEILFADKPEMEGLNLFDLQDVHGQYVVRDMINIVRLSGEGFYEYHWSKPDKEGNEFKKISFVKLVKPYDWYIGAGLYVDDIEAQIKTDLLATISRIRFGREGYIFVNRLNGDALVSNGRVITGTKKLWEVFDKNPAKTKEIFTKEYQAALQPEGDYIYYTHVKLTAPDTESPKTSFIYGIPDLQWLVGAGVYLDDVENDIALLQTELKRHIKTKLLFFLLITAGLLIFFLFFFKRLNRRLENDFKLFISFFNQAAFTDEPIDRSRVQFAELDQMAEDANKMLQDKIKAQKELTSEREALRKSEEKFRQIVENITDVYYETRLDGTICYCSPSCLDVFGYTQEELIGKKSSMLYANPDDRQLLITVLQEEGRVRNLELVFKKKNGELYDVSFTADVSLDESGNPTRFNGTIRDITAAKKAEIDIQRSKKMEVIGLMAGGVAHDLNNILSGIVGYPELMLQTLPEDSDLRKPLEAVHDSGQRAATVVADLLTVARGAASTREVHDLNVLVEEYIHSPECENLRSLYPEITYQHTCTAARSAVSCSPVHVKKCLMNLVINASESMEKSGPVSVSTRNQFIVPDADRKKGLAAGEYVVLSVCDTGSGISATDLEHIFEPFYTKKTMGRSGTGLGLAIVWNTMEDHGGKVFVESSGEGTRFHLYFPVTQEDNARSEMNINEEVGGNGEHVLVVDDEQQLRDIACQMLQSLGYTVDAVSSGEMALEYVQEHSVDVLVIDMLMEPGMNGCRTYEAIVKQFPDQKAIIASGFSESDDVKAALRLGAGCFLKKPYSMGQLGQAVRDVLNS